MIKFLFSLLIAGVILLAFWLRVDRLDTLPPGISYDEGTNIIDADHIGATGHFPLYQDVGRPEPLYRAVLAVGGRFLGPGVWSVRLMTALIGTITIAAAYWAAQQCVGDLPPHLRVIAGLAAAGSLAVALSHVVLSRAIYRAIPQPLFMFLFAGFLMRGLRTNRRRDFILGGISLALALYSYTSALFLPLALPGVALSLLIFRFKTWRAWLPNLIWLGVAFGILMAPVGWLLLTDTPRVLARISDVKGNQDILSGQIDRVWNQFFHAGDINPQYNAASVPLLPKGFDLVFKLGLLMLLVRVRHPSSILIAAWLVLAAAPVIASNEAPHGLRIIGEFAAFPLVIGVGVGGVLALLSYLPHPTGRAVGASTVAALVLALTLRDGQLARQTYLDSWDHPTMWKVYGRELAHGEWFFRLDQRDLGRWLVDQPGPLLVPLDALDWPPLRAWLVTAYPTVRAADDRFEIPARTQLVVPWVLELGDLRRDTRLYGLLQSGTITLLPPLSVETHAALLSGIDGEEAVLRPNGELMARVKPIPADLRLAYEPRTRSADPLAVFDGRMRLVGWRGPDTLAGQEAQTLTYTLDWAARKPIDHYYTVFLQLQTQSYERLAGDDVPIWRWLFPPTLWQRGDVIPNPHTLQIPADLPPGAYRLVAGAYWNGFPGKRVPIRAADGAPLGTMTTVGWIKVPQSNPPPAGQGILKPDAILGDAFALRGASATPGENGQMHLTLYWEALTDRAPVDATIFIHVIGPDGTLVDQSDTRPWDGQYPTFIWDQGERVQTDHLLAIGDASPADLIVHVGMYTLPGVTRLAAIQNGTPAPNNLVDLGKLDGLIAH